MVERSEEYYINDECDFSSNCQKGRFPTLQRAWSQTTFRSFLSRG